MTEPRHSEVLRHGQWASGHLSGHVWIVRQNWDHYFEEFHDGGPDLASDGYAYYALYGAEPSVEKHISRSITCLSALDAVAQIEKVAQSVLWDDWANTLPKSG